MLWYTGAKIETAYAQALNVHGHKYPDIGWTTYRFDSGAIGVCENVWCMPDNKGYFPDERMEIIGTEGGIYIQETYPEPPGGRYQGARIRLTRPIGRRSGPACAAARWPRSWATL